MAHATPRFTRNKQPFRPNPTYEKGHCHPPLRPHLRYSGTASAPTSFECVCVQNFRLAVFLQQLYCFIHL